MYVRNAELFQRPRTLIVESSIPARAAAVAAPIRKLWPAKCWYGRPPACSASRTWWVNFAFVRGSPFANLKNGPASVPRIAIYAVTPATGHSVQPVLPTNTSTPLPNWSVFETFSLTRRHCGNCGLSMVTSPQPRSLDGTKASLVGIMSSPARKNPKKHSTTAAHSITVSGSEAVADQCSCMLLRIAGVTGSLTLWRCGECWAWTLCMPACSRRSRDRDENSPGDGRPSVICIWRIPAR